MSIQIIEKPFNLTIHGYSGVALNKDYTGTVFQLMDRMWKAVKQNNIKNKGLNIWVYEQSEKVFAGIELENQSESKFDLEQKNITLSKYAYYKHVGPYQLIRTSGEKMREELGKKGLTVIFPYIEIYGHWDADESKLETELLMSIK